MSTATVIEVHGIRVTVELDGDAVRCAPAPDMNPYPVVGDHVAVEAGANDGDPPVITEVLHRRTTLARLRQDNSRRSRDGAQEHVLAANVDLAVIVAAIARPPFHPRFIDRYMVLAQRGGLDVAVALNKADLDEPLPDLTLYRDLVVDIVSVSAKTGEGLGDLRRLIGDKTVIFTGHSGVGKSSLVNALNAEIDAAVGEVGGKRGQGRHTTSRSSLYKLDDSTAVIDTPGIRSLSLAGIPADELGDLFPELEGFAEGCRFRDCTHNHEPGCAVKTAVEEGEIPFVRYETYLRLLHEDT